MKKRKLSVLILILFFTGLFLLLYPTVSNWWNRFHQTKIISEYREAADRLSLEDYTKEWDAAVAYNQSLYEKADRYAFDEAEKRVYSRLLNITGKGEMGYLEIPKIKVNVPIYHSTSADVLQYAAGHIPGTSLPVGGKGTHCVVSGHRGLPSARLFTDLDRLSVGDTFLVHTLNEQMTYLIDQILTVEPEQIEALELNAEQDYFTIVTCTPYGINTHRLLVRGHRIDNEIELNLVSEAIQIEPVVVAPFVSIPFLLLLSVPLFAGRRKKNRAILYDRKDFRYESDQK